MQIGYQTVSCICICNQTTNNATVSAPDVDVFEIQYNSYDVSINGEVHSNIFQWNENDIKSSQTTNGDY